jgi:hypothetical protein
MAQYPFEMLTEARNRAVRLVEGLEQRQKELEANPPVLAGDKLVQGRNALNNAIAAARRSLAALDDAIRIAHYDTRRESENRA